MHIHLEFSFHLRIPAWDFSESGAMTCDRHFPSMPANLGVASVGGAGWRTHPSYHAVQGVCDLHHQRVVP